MSEQPVAPGAWVVCDVNSNAGLQRFTAQVHGQQVQEGVLYYRVQAEFPGSRPVFGVRREQIVRVF